MVRSFRKRLLLCLAAWPVLTVSDLLAQTALTWGPNGVGAPAGGAGTWNLGSSFWTSNNGSSYQGWPASGADYIAVFSRGSADILNVDVNGNLTAAGLRFDVINYSLNIAGGGNSLTLATNTGFAPRVEGPYWTVLSTVTTTINGPIGGTSGVNFGGSGAIALAGNNTFTGGINIGGSTVTLLSNTGSFASSNVLTMGGTIADGGSIGGGGTFVYDNTGAGAATSQTLNSIVLATGDAHVQSTWNFSTPLALSFGSQTRATGATVAYFVYMGGAASPGINGTDNKINLTSQATGFIDRGTFFYIDTDPNNGGYAWKDSAGFLRGINYGSDAGTATSAGGATLTIGANSHFQITGSITAQQSATINTLKFNGSRNLTLTTGATLTVSGLLKNGGDDFIGGTTSSSTISSGTALQSNANEELIIRVDHMLDTLTINTPIVANGTTPLVKSGTGLLVLGVANTYSGTTYVNGGSIRLSNAAALPSGSNVQFNGGVLELTSSSPNTFNTGTGGGQVQWAGDGGFAAFGSAVSLTLNSGAALTWGASDFVPNGNRLILGSARSNNRLTLTNDIDLGSAMRGVQVNFGGGVNSSGVLSGKITGTGGLKITGGGSFSLTNATNTFSGGIQVIDGTLVVASEAALGSNVITFGGSANGALIMDNGTARVINNNLVFLPGSFANHQIGGTQSLTFNGSISGSGTFSTTGSNPVTFNGNSPNFTGVAQLQNAGTVTIGSDNPFGTGTIQLAMSKIQSNGSARIVPNAGTFVPFEVSGSSDLTFTGLLKNEYVGNPTVTISNTGATTFGAIDLAMGSTTRIVTFSVSASANAFITGTIANGFNNTTSALIKSGAGPLTISSTSNTYGGATTITGGVLAVTSLADGGSNSSIGKSSNAATNLIINGGTLRYTGSGSNSTNRLFQIGQSGNNQTGTIDASGSGAVNFTNTGNIGFGTTTANNARTLVLTGTSTANNTLASVLNNNSSNITSLTKNGTGTWVFSGGGNYSGATTINGGLLVMNGTSANTAVTVANTGTVGGTGSIGNLTVQNGGAVAPGNSAGTLNTKNFNLQSGGLLRLEIGGAGVGLFDQVNVVGTVSLAGDAQITLFGGYTPLIGDKFFIVVNDGSDLVTGTFANANVSNQITIPGVIFTVNYADNSGGGGAGNDVSLTVTGVPEPGAATLFLLGLGAFAMRRRRK